MKIKTFHEAAGINLCAVPARFEAFFQETSLVMLRDRRLRFTAKNEKALNPFWIQGFHIA
jgi:hypothetical protein